MDKWEKILQKNAALKISTGNLKFDLDRQFNLYKKSNQLKIREDELVKKENEIQRNRETSNLNNN